MENPRLTSSRPPTGLVRPPDPKGDGGVYEPLFFRLLRVVAGRDRGRSAEDGAAFENPREAPIPKILGWYQAELYVRTADGERAR